MCCALQMMRLVPGIFVSAQRPATSTQETRTCVTTVHFVCSVDFKFVTLHARRLPLNSSVCVMWVGQPGGDCAAIEGCSIGAYVALQLIGVGCMLLSTIPCCINCCCAQPPQQVRALLPCTLLVSPPVEDDATIAALHPSLATSGALSCCHGVNRGSCIYLGSA